MLRACCFFILLNCFFLHLNAQREVNVWYFGYGAGIDFNASSPIALTDGKLFTKEGCASICDENGKLLMYTDGVNVYNNQHTLMVNGTGLHGHPSSAQSGMIIKLPKSDSLYLVFNPGEATGAVVGYYYSLVNVYAKNGQGEVITKNVKLKDNMRSESVAAVRHANGEDIWVIFRNDNSNEFVAYKVTSLGVSNTMVFSQPGPTINTSGGQVPLCSKFSPTGKKYAISIYNKGVCIYDFDNKTGYLSNLKFISMLDPYGIEFSPDESKLYVTVKGGLYQYDLSSNNINSIIASQYQVLPDSFLGALQLAPDKRIYAAQFGSPYLGTISLPNMAKSACNAKIQGFYLAGKTSASGLPPFISTYFSDSINSKIVVTGKCMGETWKFTCTNLKTEDSLSWDFGEPSSGAGNKAIGQNVTHQYLSGDTFTVNVWYYRKNINKHFELKDILHTQIKVIRDLGRANEFPPLVEKCTGSWVSLNTKSDQSSFSKITWSDSSGTAFSRSVKTPGWYASTIYKAGSQCMYYDSTLVRDKPYTIKPQLGKDTTYCKLSSQSLNIMLGKNMADAGKYTWSTGANSKTITISQPGTYFVNAENNGECASADTITISTDALPFYTKIRDTGFCQGLTGVMLDLNAEDYKSIAWNTGQSGTSILANLPGKYVYVVSNQCATYRDSFNLSIYSAPVVDLGADFMACSNNGFEMKSNVQGKSYRWMPMNESSEEITSYTSGLITLEVTSDNGCVGKDEVLVGDSCHMASYVPNAFSPNGDGLNELFRPSNNDVREEGYVFRIFDRWGGLIFETRTVNGGWNGSNNDALCPSGVYFYTLEFLDTGKREIRMAGTFHLER